MQDKDRRVLGFVDWENIRLRLADNYVEKISVDKVLNAIEKVANEVGSLQLCSVYGDWSLRRQEAQEIQQKPRFKPIMVLRTGRKDQTDPVMIADILEAIFNKQTSGFGHIVVCAGDSNYADVIRRGFAKEVKMHVCAVGRDVSKELTALAPFYPLERYLEMPPTQKEDLPSSLPGITPQIDPKMAKLIDILNSVEKKLPYVAYLYFRDKIMPSYSLFAEGDERERIIRRCESLGVVKILQKENPVNPGRLFRVITLNVEHDLTKQVLKPTQKEMTQP